MSQSQLEMYATYMGTLGNRPDLFDIIILSLIYLSIITVRSANCRTLKITIPSGKSKRNCADRHLRNTITD